MTAGSETESEAGRYTVVFTGPYPGKGAGEYPFLTEDESGELMRGRPPAERLEREVEFSALPERVRRRALDEYRGLWSL